VVRPVFAEAVRRIRELSRDIYMEVLIPDFNLNIEAIKTVVDAGPNIISHDIESVERLKPIKVG